VVASSSGLPFDDFRALVAKMPGPDEAAAAAVRTRDAVLTKPAGSLGRLESLVEWLAAWQAKAPPTVNRPLVAIFAGNHGVTAQGVSAFPAAVTRQMVDNFAAGGAAMTCLAYQGVGFGRGYEESIDQPPPPVSRDAEIAAAAGAAFGLVYWMIAGRRAGVWRNRPPAPPIA